MPEEDAQDLDFEGRFLTGMGNSCTRRLTRLPPLDMAFIVSASGIWYIATIIVDSHLSMVFHSISLASRYTRKFAKFASVKMTPKAYTNGIRKAEPFYLSLHYTDCYLSA